MGRIGFKNKDYCLIPYTIFISTAQEPIFTKLIVQMYDKKGEIVFNKQWNNTLGFQYGFSGNNKYLCYIIPQGIKEKYKSTYYIYDIKNKTILYNSKLSNGITTDVYCENDKVMFTSPDNKLIFDTKEMLIYKYRFENGKYINIGNIKRFNIK